MRISPWGILLVGCALVACLIAVAASSMDWLSPEPTSAGRALRASAELGLVTVGPSVLAAVVSVVARIRIRRRRAFVRYELMLAQSDEATAEDVASAYEQLVQTVRVTRIRRVLTGQPWVAIESWFASDGADTAGRAFFALVCDPDQHASALAAMRHAYPGLSVVTSSPDDRSLMDDFRPRHVLRLRKVKAWALPIGSAASSRDASNAHSVMAAVIRQQQLEPRTSCVRWCLLPAAERLDGRASQRLDHLMGDKRGDAIGSDVVDASRAAGGAMCFLELQAAVARGGGRGRVFGDGGWLALHSACRRLVAPALSQRGANHLRERLVVVRQPVYRRRWRRAEPPLVPHVGGVTLVSPRELATIMALPSLASEHALPVKRNTIPVLPVPVEVRPAALVDLPAPPTSATAVVEAQA